METIIDTGIYINNLSDHFHLGEHMRLLTQTRVLRSSPRTNTRHMPGTDLVEVSDWSRQGTSSAGRLGRAERQRVRNVWVSGGPSRVGLDSSNTIGNGWDPYPPQEAQNKPLEYKRRLSQEGGDAAGVTANNQALTEKEWKAPAVKMRRSGRLDRYVETFSIRFTTPENRPKQTNHKQSILRLHWLTHQRKGGGHGDGTIGGKWAVSTDGDGLRSQV